MPATKDRATPKRAGVQFADPLADSAVIYAGTLYALNASGNAVAATASGTTVRAVATKFASQPGGDERIEGEIGVFAFDNSATAAIARADIGANAYVEDNQTVAKTGTAVAGVVVDVDDTGVWVRVGAQVPPAASGD